MWMSKCTRPLKGSVQWIELVSAVPLSKPGKGNPSSLEIMIIVMCSCAVAISGLDQKINHLVLEVDIVAHEQCGCVTHQNSHHNLLQGNVSCIQGMSSFEIKLSEI